ncbi:MAG: hypothetical protein BWX80_03343 [Candidatus Hydrogenedentes bacterium ADurb.Bin101]|nr:MAG: hypothetical protein BWX80_03343 [Candidatus Hydrogenedentes bacterium ADurb.Bin101]
MSDLRYIVRINSMAGTPIFFDAPTHDKISELYDKYGAEENDFEVFEKKIYIRRNM